MNQCYHASFVFIINKTYKNNVVNQVYKNDITTHNTLTKLLYEYFPYENIIRCDVYHLLIIIKAELPCRNENYTFDGSFIHTFHEKREKISQYLLGI